MLVPATMDKEILYRFKLQSSSNLSVRNFVIAIVALQIRCEC